MRYLDPKSRSDFQTCFRRASRPGGSASERPVALKTPGMRSGDRIPSGRTRTGKSFTQEQYRGRPLPRCRRTSVYRRDANDLVSGFRQRVLFNASKAYVRQIDTGQEYELLQPVYSLNLVNEVFEPELEGFIIIS